jgi:hypothetical protein
MKKLLIIGAVLGIGSFLLIVTLYNTTDIPLIDEIVESTAKTLNVMPTMIAKKIERKVEEEKQLAKETEELKKEVIEEPISKPIEPKVDSSSYKKEQKLQQAKRFEAEKNKLLAEVKTSNTTKAVVVDSMFNAQVVKKPEPVKEEPSFFNVVKKEKPKSGASPVKENKVIFLAKVHNTQTVTNDSPLYLRLVSATQIGGEEFPANYVFQGKVNIFDHRLIVNIAGIGTKKINSKNLDDTMADGVVLDERHFQRSNIVLSDGEILKFYL